MRALNIPTALLILLLALSPIVLEAAEHTVNIVGLTFDPADMVIDVGDTVTWVNDGGVHNVVGDGFTSGPPSSDPWTYSYTFHHGGDYPYVCEVHEAQGMVGTVTVEGIFGDPFESGDTMAWSDTTPLRPTCTCYFSGDCAGGALCDYGPGGFGTEDICTWVDGKPNGNPGTNCDLPHEGPWGGPICDGICSASAAGSEIGWEPSEVVAEGVRLWGEALLVPAEAGGGPPDPALVEEIFDLDFDSSLTPMSLGRQVADVLILAGSPGFYEHFCHWEQHPDEPDPSIWVDLSGDPCRAGAAWLVLEALSAELDKPGSCGPVVARIPDLCEDWQELFGPRCPAGPDTLACVTERIEATGEFLSTPRQSANRHFVP